MYGTTKLSVQPSVQWIRVTKQFNSPQYERIYLYVKHAILQEGDKIPIKTGVNYGYAGTLRPKIKSNRQFSV
jgi:hypothetical protein